VHCPVHDASKSGRPDLSVSEKRGLLLVYCHVCGKLGQSAIVDELKLRDLWPESETGASGQRTETRRVAWTIRDLSGAPQAVHERIEFSDGSKDFRWKGADGRPGLGGRKSASLPLYGTELLAGLPANGTVILCEGEKAADAARTLGVVALGTVTGAGNSVHADAVLRELLPFRVVLWPDHDQKGRQHMAEIGRRLVAMGMAE
jgi:hypothetical protein